jgi:N-methylhydantoinase B
VVVADDGSADLAATEELRASLRAARTGDEPFFDRGPGYALLSGGATSNEFDVL